MIVRSYTGRTVPEALEKVRGDLGERALIIETRPVAEGGLFGRRAGFEVVAACDDRITPSPAPAAAKSAPAKSAPAMSASAASPRSELPQLRDAASQAQALRAAQMSLPQSQTALGVEEELRAIRRQIARLAAGTGTPSGHLGEALTAALEDAELPAEIIAELDAAVAAAGDRLPADRKLDFTTACLARALPATGEGLDWSQVRHLLMVGPTGVGKTTTIAKLAGDLVLRQRRSVALVTIDTYRVGAQDQLRAYADLLDAPCEVATSPAHLAEVLRRFAGVDHVLIDTAGRNPGDSARVHELKAFCRAAPGLAVTLAIGANAGRAEFAAVVERFSILPIEHAVVTKLDECAALGRLYGCLRRHRLPLRFLTTGQEVPADIEIASRERLVAGLIPAALREPQPLAAGALMAAPAEAGASAA